MDKRITLHERVLTIDNLDHLARQLNAAATWLGEHDFEVESDKVEQSAVLLAAVCHLLERPLLRDLPPSRWNGADMPGQHVREPRLRRPVPWQARTGARSGSLTRLFAQLSAECWHGHQYEAQQGARDARSQRSQPGAASPAALAAR
jgi:hypothetical protein